MNYTEITFLITPVDPWRDILMVELAEIGFDSFDESFSDPLGPSGELKAYIPSEQFDEAAIPRLLTLRDPHVSVSWTSREIPSRNWNAEWERSFQPVEVGKEVRIRADFHPSVPGFTHELIITPRMAFGTGHHATTRMMVQAMLGIGIKGRSVCDLGCGTGVLAILAERMGASSVLAIDNDQGAVDNARENVARNNCHVITVEKGTAMSLEGLFCDIILANIERNVLLDAMKVMYDALQPGGVLFLSGFVPADRPLLEERAERTGFALHERMNEGDWALLGCRKR